VAGQQFGRVRWDQIIGVGTAETTLRRWVSTGYLHPVLPRVYAVGHAAPSTESDLSAAVLYAGPGAMLSHGTAAWWLGLLKYPPEQIHVSTPRNLRDRDGITVHGRRNLERIDHKGLPTTTVAQTVLDFAATGRPDLLRLVLANADYEDRLDPADLERLMGPGVAGSAALRRARRLHLPELARTRSHLEVLLLGFCQTQRLPIPLVNVYVEGCLVDAFWPDRRLVVQVDGWRGHRTPAQLQHDHQQDLQLRLAGYVVLRYAYRQLTEAPGLVAIELTRWL
jgi:hypothetical protein